MTVEMPNCLVFIGLIVDVVGFVMLIGFGPPPHWVNWGAGIVPSFGKTGDSKSAGLRTVLQWLAVIMIVLGFGLQAAGTWVSGRS